MLRKRAGLDALSSTEEPGIRTFEGGGEGESCGGRRRVRVHWVRKVRLLQLPTTSVLPHRCWLFDANHPRRKT